MSASPFAPSGSGGPCFVSGCAVCARRGHDGWLVGRPAPFGAFGAGQDPTRISHWVVSLPRCSLGIPHTASTRARRRPSVCLVGDQSFLHTTRTGSCRHELNLSRATKASIRAVELSTRALPRAKARNQTLCSPKGRTNSGCATQPDSIELNDIYSLCFPSKNTNKCG